MQPAFVLRGDTDMELISGSGRLGLWHVHVWWSGSTVHRIRFSRDPLPGPIPPLLVRYLAGQPVDPVMLDSTAIREEEPFFKIYQEVRKVVYGTTATYGEIGRKVGQYPRVIGIAMRRNPTPLVIPCHRIVSASGPGGFSPDIGIKLALLAMERKNRRRFVAVCPSNTNMDDRSTH